MKKYLSTLFFMSLSSISTYANEIVCNKAGSQELAMEFSSRHPIPDYNFEKFKYHSASGSVFIRGKDLGTQWLEVKDSGFSLDYEIKIHSASRRPVAYVHLSFEKSGNFNGYQQFNNGLSGQLVIEQLNCRFVSMPTRMNQFTGSFLPSNQDGPPYYCVISGRGFWCDASNCSKCVPARN